MRLSLIKYGNITDYNNNPPSTVSFMTAIASTSGRLHSEFIRLLFLQDHRETDRFFAASGVQFPESTSGLFHFRLTVFSTTLNKSRQHPRQGFKNTIGLVFNSRFLDS
jgi:hypothetical protein